MELPFAESYKIKMVENIRKSTRKMDCRSEVQPVRA